ncbi:MAG: dihydroorotate dehydrogenase, partial [Deltaproteobacteria bacterium]|nr:dihydroorotate dehydrogenase [Deltaproteobacteria bacterium]
MKPNLKVKIGRLELKNPIMTASGTFGYGEEFNENFYDISKLGGIVTKGISLKPREGNPMPRVVETASGMLNSIGLQNVGVDDYIKGKLPYLKKTGALIVANVLGNNTNEYNKIASLLNPLDEIAALEVNISCPNVKKGGVQFGTDPKAAAGLVKSIRKVFKKTLIVKLSPNYHNIPLIAKSVADAGADAISLINTITAMAIDAETRRPILSAVTGGLSGPAIKPIALRMVWEASKAVKIPVIGIG